MGALNSVITGLAPFAPLAQHSLPLVRGAQMIFEGVSDLIEDPQDQQRKLLRAQQDQALRQLREKQAADLQDLRERRALESERMTADTRAAEEKRRSALRRAVARQRAQFASQGVGTGGSGSSEAVLLGLFEESDEERQQRTRLDDIRSRALEQDVSARQRLNVLQRSQLAARQELERAIEGF